MNSLLKEKIKVRSLQTEIRQIEEKNKEDDHRMERLEIALVDLVSRVTKLEQQQEQELGQRRTHVSGRTTNIVLEMDSQMERMHMKPVSGTKRGHNSLDDSDGSGNEGTGPRKRTKRRGHTTEDPLEAGGRSELVN